LLTCKVWGSMPRRFWIGKECFLFFCLIFQTGIWWPLKGFNCMAMVFDGKYSFGRRKWVGRDRWRGGLRGPPLRPLCVGEILHTSLMYENIWNITFLGDYEFAFRSSDQPIVPDHLEHSAPSLGGNFSLALTIRSSDQDSPVLITNIPCPNDLSTSLHDHVFNALTTRKCRSIASNA
jgi:hypothetical protein